MPPTVTVIIPTFNRSVLLNTSVHSIQLQTCRDWELIIADDGSSDDTEKLIGDMVCHDNRIRYFRLDHSGVSKARNEALVQARGAYIAFLDDDDEYLPDKLAIQADYLNTHPDIGFVYGQIEIVDGQGKYLYTDPKQPVFD